MKVIIMCEQHQEAIRVDRDAEISGFILKNCEEGCPDWVDPDPTNIHLTEDEKLAISSAFDAWGHDYTLLFPVVEKIVKDRLKKE